MEFDSETQLEKPPFIDSVKSLLKIPAWWAMCFGIAFASFVSYAKAAFQTKYLIALDPTFDFQTLVIILGIMNGTTYAAGAFFGAKLADKWGNKDIRAYGLLPALAISLAIPVSLASWWVPSVELHLMFGTVFLLLIGFYLGPSFAIAQTLAPINMRAMSTALFFFILNMIGMGGGPTFAGWLMDVFGEGYTNVESIRYSLSVVTLVFIPSIIAFFVVSKVLPNDWSQAEKRNMELARD